HRSEIARRTGDHTQHFGRRRLLLQCFAQIVSALPQLIEETRVLDGDDGLGGEIRKQPDLLVSERSNFLTKDDDDSSWLTVFEHRNCNGAANASARRGEIGDLGGPLSSDCLAHWPARNGAERTAASYFDKCRGYIVRAAYSKSVTFAEIEQPELGPA